MSEEETKISHEEDIPQLVGRVDDKSAGGGGSEAVGVGGGVADRQHAGGFVFARADFALSREELRQIGRIRYDSRGQKPRIARRDARTKSV